MRAAIGLVVLHAMFAAVGFALLRAIGLMPRAAGRAFFLAALGPALLCGAVVLGCVLFVLLVFGVPLTPLGAILVAFVLLASAAAVGRIRRGRHPASPVGTTPGTTLSSTTSRGTTPPALRALAWVSGIAAAICLGYGLVVFARLPTVGDDALIWSLKGMTIYYTHVLAPFVFQNAGQAGGHPAYPLLSPVLEALGSEAAGSPVLRWYHSELWLLAGAGLWSAAFLLWRRSQTRSAPNLSWVALAVPMLMALSFEPVWNILNGDQDAVAAVLLSVGVLGFGLWLEGGDRSDLAFGVIMLAAAASIKDEDYLAGVIVLLIVGCFVVATRLHPRARQRRRGECKPFLLAACYFVAVVAPWRVWLTIHHLSESVEPPLPRSLSPVYLVDTHHVNLVVTALLSYLDQYWPWLLPLFIVSAVVSLTLRSSVRAASFYRVVMIGLAMMLFWLYAATPVPLSYLIPSSMDRTVGLLAIPAAFAAAHLLASLLVKPAQ